MNRCLLVLLLVTWVSRTALGQDAKPTEARWPQFRGPGGQGFARNGMKLPAEFGPAKNVLWQTALPAGHSSPCIWDDRIYLTGFDKKTQKLETICLARRDGKILWRQAAPVEKLERVHQLNNVASSTPATDGERVYVYFGSFGLLCYDKGGKELWKRPIPPIPGGFGSGTSPATAGEFVLLNAGPDGANFILLALDKKTGKTVWKTYRPRGASTGLWSTPVVRPRQGGQEVLVTGGGDIIAYNLSDGTERWRLSGLPPISLSSFALGEGLACVSLTNQIGEADAVAKLPPFDEAIKSFDKDKDGKIAFAEVPEDFMLYRRGRADKIGDWSPLRERMRGFDRNKDGGLDKGEWQALADSLAKTAQNSNVAVFCVKLDGQGDVSKTHVLWKQTKAVGEVPSPLCHQGRIYLVTEKGIITCRDAKTGKEHYRERLGVEGACYASPVAGDGKIYAACDRGVLVILKAGETFEPYAKIQFDEPIVATPALVDGKIYLRTGQRLYAFGAKSNDQ